MKRTYRIVKKYGRFHIERKSVFGWIPVTENCMDHHFELAFDTVEQAEAAIHEMVYGPKVEVIKEITLEV